MESLSTAPTNPPVPALQVGATGEAGGGVWMPRPTWRRRTREFLFRAEVGDVRIAVALREEVTEFISEG